MTAPLRDPKRSWRIDHDLVSRRRSPSPEHRLGERWLSCRQQPCSHPAKADDAEVASPVKVDDFRLTDQTLHSHDLRRMADAKAIVLITQQDGWPSTATPVLRALQGAFAAKGVEFFMLNSTPADAHRGAQQIDAPAWVEDAK
jgi:hypothetical protein